jgi:putative peptidoglycan lipid II flippase
MKQKFTSTIAGASIFITAVLLIGRGLGLIREVIFANYFGLSAEYDLYLVATVLPITINSIILYIAQNYFIPNYHSAKKISENEAVEFTGSSVWLFLFGGLFISLILFALSDQLFSLYLAGVSANSLESTTNLFKIILIAIPVFSASSVFSAYLQAKFEFRLPSLSQLLLNIAMIILVLAFHNSIGVTAIVIGYVAGVILQLFMLLYFVQKELNIFQIKFFTKKKYLRFVSGSVILIVVIESLSQLFIFSDRYFYNSVEPGGIAALNYAIHLYMLPLSIISLAISTAIFPSFSKSINEETIEAEKHLNNFFSINIILFVPITIIIIFFGDVLIKMLYERGEFSAHDSEMTYSVLKIYAYSLIFYSSYAVLNKLIYSKKLIKYLLLVAVISISLKIIMNFVFVDNLKQDGLALSSTLSYTSFFIFSFALVLYKVRLTDRSFFARELLWSLVNGTVSYLISLWVSFWIFENVSLISKIIMVIIFISIYTLNTVIAKHHSVTLLTNAMLTYKHYRKSQA